MNLQKLYQINSESDQPTTQINTAPNPTLKHLKASRQYLSQVMMTMNMKDIFKRAPLEIRSLSLQAEGLIKMDPLKLAGSVAKIHLLFNNRMRSSQLEKKNCSMMVRIHQ